MDYALTVKQPFRVVPYFDASVWGGQWMKEKFNLDPEADNFGWAFDGVPEENSLYLRYGDVRVEVPSLNVIHQYPNELLGPKVHSRFGKEFPIRFDYLDTMEGGNLSLQVHPLTEYIQDKFGMHYTQDESYYILDAKEDATVYLGVKDGIKLDDMIGDLEKAQEEGDYRFPDEKYVNCFPAKKHDHFLIPAGTVHCGGSNVVVLEISATPYIFTFKLWDWGRIGLDGRPRPVHINHGKENIQLSRTTDWVKENLINNVQVLEETESYKEERTGLHELEFIETRRHWFKESVELDTKGSVNMLNLIEGDTAVVESVDGSFEPYEVHYGETFIIPAQLEKYKITPPDQSMYDAVKANWDGVAKPLDGLGWFEHVISQIGAIEKSTNVCISKRAVIVMCADNGVVKEGISQSGQEVTLAVAQSMEDVNRVFVVWHQHHIQMLFQ